MHYIYLVSGNIHSYCLHVYSFMPRTIPVLGPFPFFALLREAAKKGHFFSGPATKALPSPP